MPQNNIPEIELAFFNDGYRIAKATLESGLNPDMFLNLSNTIFHYIDSFNELVIENCRNENVNIDCKKGCDFCCHQPVWILPFEAYYLHNYLNEQKPPNKKISISERIIKKDEITKKMKVQEFLHFKHPCPFLINKACSVHEARPMACRIYLSLDVNTCKKEFNDSKNPDQFPNLLNITLRAGKMLNEGICKYLSEKGLHIREWLLESQMNLLLEKPHIFKEWVEGKDHFIFPELTEDESDYISKITNKH